MEGDRRSFLKSLAVTAVAPAVSMERILAEGSNVTAEQSRRRPSLSAHPKNIVVMICDDLGYGDLGCYGSGIKTLTWTSCSRWRTIQPLQFGTSHLLCFSRGLAYGPLRATQRNHFCFLSDFQVRLGSRRDHPCQPFQGVGLPNHGHRKVASWGCTRVPSNQTGIRLFLRRSV